MKTKAMKKILSMLLVCVMLVGALAGFNVFAAGDPTIEIASNNVWYGEALYPMYAVETTGDIAGYEIEVKVTVNEKTYTCIEVNDDPKYGTCYVAPVGVAAQNINTVYEATPYLKNNDEVVATGDTQTYSVLEYLYERLYVTGKNTVATNDDPTDAEKTMYNALIDYAVAADAVINEKAPNNIGSYYYVNVEGGVSGMYKKDDVIKATTDREAGAGEELVWIVTGTDGNLIDTLSLEEMANTGYTVGTIGVIITLDTEVIGAPEWTLVTDASSLKAGDQIVIVAANSSVALSTTQNGNNRGQAAVVKDGNTNTLSFTDGVEIITLEAGTIDGTLAFNVGDGYLFAASSSGNYLRTEASLSANSSWKVTITDGVASVVAQGTSTRNIMRYNSSSSIFACYGNGQQDICIYKLG